MEMEEENIGKTKDYFSGSRKKKFGHTLDKADKLRQKREDTQTPVSYSVWPHSISQLPIPLALSLLFPPSLSCSLSSPLFPPSPSLSLTPLPPSPLSLSPPLSPPLSPWYIIEAAVTYTSFDLAKF